MGLTKVHLLVLVLLSVNLALSKTILEDPFSRDNIESVAEVNKESIETTKPATKPATLEGPLHGRVQCEYEEATEDQICLEHCVPKGYSYGLCVSNVCSCV